MESVPYFEKSVKQPLTLLGLMHPARLVLLYCFNTYVPISLPRWSACLWSNISASTTGPCWIHLQPLSMIHAEFLKILHFSAVVLLLFFFIFCSLSGSKHLNQTCLSVWRPTNETSQQLTTPPQQHKSPWQAPITVRLCQPLLRLGIWR